MRPDPLIQRVWAQAFTIPTDFPEADGTTSWTSTTIIVVHAEGGGRRGIGYTYADASVVALIASMLAEVAKGSDAMDPPAVWRRMQIAVRNLGREGLAMEWHDSSTPIRPARWRRDYCGAYVVALPSFRRPGRDRSLP